MSRPVPEPVGRRPGEASVRSARRFPVGRLTAVAAVGVVALLVARGAAGPRFSTLEPGLEFATLHGEPYCRSGSTRIAVVRIDPTKVALQVRHYSREPDQKPISITEWQRRTGAAAVFNAGQYYPDFSYMGLLVSGGEVISRRLHPKYKAALVASPVADGPEACVLDLTQHEIDPDSAGWREVAQSFMIFDRDGNLRIRRSNLVAQRTAVGQDRRGRLLVITSEGGYTLHEFARLLQSSPLHLTHAMSMDGGQEAELCVKTAGFRYASFGPWPSDDALEAPRAQVPLPAVVAVMAR